MTGEAAAVGLLGSTTGARTRRIGAVRSLVVGAVRFATATAVAQRTAASTSVAWPGRTALHSTDSP